MHLLHEVQPVFVELDAVLIQRILHYCVRWLLSSVLRRNSLSTFVARGHSLLERIIVFTARILDELIELIDELLALIPIYAGSEAPPVDAQRTGRCVP